VASPSIDAGVDPCLAVEDGVRLFVRVTAGARAAAIGGTFALPVGRALEIRVTARAVDGAANAAVVAALAAALGVPKRAVTIVSGAAARLKRLHVAGNPAALKPKLDALAAAA
jgi:uncharacterized protein YggU (UPF0235/DUF167 family)